MTHVGVNRLNALIGTVSIACSTIEIAADHGMPMVFVTLASREGEQSWNLVVSRAFSGHKDKSPW